jgi:threonine dehydrogenase-like Zn-dependent dehydrogenase
MHTAQLELPPGAASAATIHGLVMRFTVTTPMLIKAVQVSKLQTGKLVTHRFAMNDILKAYGTFGNAANEAAIEVALKAEPSCL